ncbi:MAG TPA: peptidyl-prolyl cis-trans isomerase [Terriglobales bacterium]|nr:peptidyl-prolyl cis-trans isomerase [Terriglobales bacterium]
MIRFLQTPGPTKKIVLGGLLLLICAAMVITLVPGGLGSDLGFGGPPAGVVAKVAGQNVTVNEVQQQAKQMLRQQFPKGGAQMGMLLPFFASRAAEQLINEKAIVAEAQRMGLHASDEEVRDELQHGGLGTYLFPGGNYIGDEAYEDFVSRNFEMTIPQFEQAEKDNILARKLRQVIAGSAIVTESEIRQEFDQKNTKVKFQYAVLNVDDIKKGLHPTEEELKAYYDQHKASYNNSIPEKRKIKYVLFDTSKLQAQTQISQPELQNYYDQHRDEYRVPEQVKVSHILIKTPLPGPDGKVDQKGVEEARKKAEDILKQLKAGAKFEDLAKKYSEDPGSAKENGSLGWIGRGRTVPEFEKVAFSLPKGQISDVVQSSYGFHIIRVDDKQDAHMKSLAEVKDQIEPVLKQQKSAQAAENEANSLLNQARTDGIDKAAAAKGLQPVTSDFFARTETLPGIGSSPQFMDAVFGAREKAPPDMVQVPQGFAVYEVEAVKPPATPSFQEIRARVEEEFKNDRANTLLHQKAQELSDRAKSAHDLAKAAKELGATLKTGDLVTPEGQVPDIGSMGGPASVAFSMKPGDISGPIDANGHGIVLALTDKQQPTDQDFAQKKDQIRDQLLQSKQNELFGLFIDNLRKDMEKAGKIKVNQQELKNLSRSPTEEGE